MCSQGRHSQSHVKIKKHSPTTPYVSRVNIVTKTPNPVWNLEKKTKTKDILQDYFFLCQAFTEHIPTLIEAFWSFL